MEYFAAFVIVCVIVAVVAKVRADKSRPRPRVEFSGDSSLPVRNPPERTEIQ